jgi:UPF0755 protein
MTDAARWLLRVVIAATVTATVLAVGGGVWLWWELSRPRVHHDIEVVVPEGATVTAVTERLAAAGVAPSPLASRLYITTRASGRAPRFGRYRFAAGTRPWEALEQVLDGRVAMFEVTLVEGLTAAETGAAFVATGVGDPDTWAGLVADPGLIADLAPRATSLEGFLFPDTYRFAVGIEPRRVVSTLIREFETVWDEIDRGPDTRWGSVDEVVTLASLVEAETSLEDERRRIAGVFINRLDRGMLLQCDPTVVYALKQRGTWTGRLLRVHWQLDDPYNTYRYPGLPPGPINSPGRAALVAALDPEVHDFLYFVARPEGGHAFSRTLAEHNRAVARLRRARR